MAGGKGSDGVFSGVECAGSATLAASGCAAVPDDAEDDGGIPSCCTAVSQVSLVLMIVQWQT